MNECTHYTRRVVTRRYVAKNGIASEDRTIQRNNHSVRSNRSLAVARSCDRFDAACNSHHESNVKSIKLNRG